MDISKSLGYKDFLWAIKLNRLSLDFIGLWPKTDEVAKKKLGSDIRAGFAFIMMVFVSGIPLVHALIRVWGNMTLMIDNLRITLPVLTICLQFVIMRWKQTVISSIIKTIAEDWTATKLNTERDVMIKQARIARLIVIIVCVIMGLAFVILIFFPYFGIQIRHLTNLTDRNKPLPLQTYYIYDTDKDLQFVLTFFFQVIPNLLVLISYVAINTFLAFVILHICGQLENFKCRIVNLVSCKDFDRALSSNIMIHLRLIRYANSIENTFTFVLFLSVLLFGVIFCLCGFAFLTVIKDENLNSKTFSKICYFVIIVLSQLMQIFFYCFGGDLIIARCAAIYRTICDLEWYTLESRKARNFILLMLLAKEPFRITAGKVLPLTMTTFCSLLKTTASYVSVLLTTQS
ncbi:Odorant receptor 202 [Nylanderia fulva]|uniref:Odorant receptor n=1 Tax=Nylanderia fulva TaxID=613905 RepID=A0A6G1LPE2_9HYME|nr:odorant receptor 43a-like [Nylanderia fulva]KAF3054330.1 Odorant receptor 202 [Nylanderia fulva]